MHRFQRACFIRGSLLTSERTLEAMRTQDVLSILRTLEAMRTQGDL
jgi:hypothetical protein